MPPLENLEVEYPIINAVFQRFCASYGIFSVEDFLLHDFNKLLSYAEAEASSEVLKEGILQIISIIDSRHQPWLSGMQLLEDALQNHHFIPTGFEEIDTLLKGGLHEGQVTEIVGPSSSGKTQLCLHAASHAVDKQRGSVMFLDTCNSFSPRHVACIVNQFLGPISNEAKEKRLKMIMTGILCQSVYDMFALLDLLHQLELMLKVRSKDAKICLLVIDSISSLIAPVLGGKDSYGRSLMISAGLLLKKLAEQHNLAVLVKSQKLGWNRLLDCNMLIKLAVLVTAIVVVLLVRFFSLSFSSLSSRIKVVFDLLAPQNKVVTNHMVGGDGGTLKPALGESWKCVPHVRLLLHREQGSNRCSMSVLKHSSVACGRAIEFMIADEAP